MFENNTNRLALGAVAAIFFVMTFTALLTYQSSWNNQVQNYKEEHRMVE